MCHFVWGHKSHVTSYANVFEHHPKLDLFVSLSHYYNVLSKLHKSALQKARMKGSWHMSVLYCNIAQVICILCTSSSAWFRWSIFLNKVSTVNILIIDWLHCNPSEVKQIKQYISILKLTGKQIKTYQSAQIIWNLSQNTYIFILDNQKTSLCVQLSNQYCADDSEKTLLISNSNSIWKLFRERKQSK